jgi:peptide deformylase
MVNANEQALTLLFMKIIYSLFVAGCLFLYGCTSMTDLPSYVVINDPKCPNRDVLRQPAKTLSFPLTEEDKKDIETLVDKYDQEDNCAGLAAPQIGISKRIIVFAVHDDPQLKKWRPDLTDTMPKTLWINPSYEPVEEDKHIDYEGCFSVNDVTGPVPRFKTIRYKAYTLEGNSVEGIVHGFLARLIQHEVDHLNGRCFIDYVAQEDLLNIEEYRKRRRKAMESS